MARVVDSLKPSRGGLLKKTVVGALACLVLYAIIGFFVMPLVVRSLITTYLSERLHRDVTIQTVSINPFMLTVQVQKGVITEPIHNLELVSFDELFMNLEAARCGRVDQSCGRSA